MNDVLAPLLIAVTGLPALGIAAWSSRDGSNHARGAGLRWALIALSLFVGAICLYFAAGHRALMWAVVIALAVAVNALAVSLILHLRHAATGARKP